MPSIDVTDILADSFISNEAFWVFRRLQKVNNHGRTEIQSAWLPAAGSIYPTGDNSLVRQEAFQVQANTITVVTPFRLRGQAQTPQGDNYQPDLVYWDLDFYMVKKLNDYSKYGVGFMEAECSSIQFNDRPPTPPPGMRPGEMDFSNAVNSGLLAAFGVI